MRDSLGHRYFETGERKGVTMAIVKRLQNLARDLDIRHVVVWGHPLHSHTHSYIHEAFYHSAQYAGFDTYWVPQIGYLERGDNPLVDYSGPTDHCLFVTEGQVVDGIPQSDTSWYIMHNVEMRTDLSNIPESRRIYMQFYSHDSEPITMPLFDPFQRINIKDRYVCMPWGTNLLPNEFPGLVDWRRNEKVIHVVGQNGVGYREKIKRFADSVSDKMGLQHRSAGVTNEKMIHLMRSARVAPALIAPVADRTRLYSLSSS